MLRVLYTLLAPLALMVAMNVKATPLHNAVQANDVALVLTLTQADEGLREARDHAGRTPLLLATELNHIDAARVLIDAGADVNAKDSKQDSPYLLAGAEGRLEILKMTLDHGADLTSTNRYGGTALIPAAERGHVEVVRTLIGAGIDVDHVNRLGWTALLEAIILASDNESQQEVVRLLIAAGADVNLPDRDGVSPLEHAERRGYTAIAAMLRAAGAR